MSDKMLAARHWRTAQRQHLRGVAENAEPILPRHRDEAARRTHLVFVCRFYRNLERRAFRNEVAVRWQERLKKGEHTLFTFLKYDRVPWNNNNAEHATKTFARLRRIIAGSSTLRGLADYLVLLSIYQTCKYMDVDFLDFLCSGENDIHAFAESRRTQTSFNC
jgi:Transposase IS66 family